MLQMTAEEAAAAAAELPEERLIQRTHSLVQIMKPFKSEEGEHSLLLGGEEGKDKEAVRCLFVYRSGCMRVLSIPGTIVSK